MKNEQVAQTLDRSRRPGAGRFRDTYEERLLLYRRYADAEVDCTSLNHEQVVRRIILCLS